MTKKKTVDKNLNSELVTAINELLKEVTAEPKEGEEAKYSLTDKCKIIDRALQLEKIKQKINDEDWGSGFLPPEDEKEDA